MPLLFILIAIVADFVALAFILYPFYRRKPTFIEDAGNSNISYSHDISASKDTKTRTGEQDSDESEDEQIARTALHEVELDYQLGNISESDYRALRERYMRRALVALKSRHEHEEAEQGQDGEEGQGGQEQDLDAVIEEQLCVLRENKENDAK